MSAALLRAWERRYGVVAPARTQSRYRLYDDAAIERLRTMRRLVDEGWSPSAAAAAILAGEVTVEPVRDDAARSGAAAANADEPSADAADELADRLIAAARDLSSPAIEAVLDDVFSRGSFERVTGDLLFPALRRLGDAWASGTLSVAGEHLASHAVLRRLGIALDGAGQSRMGRPRVVVALPPGSRHELGALGFAVAARRAGLAVDYLGADLPIEDWVGAAAGADAAVIGVVTRRDRASAADVARALRDAHPGLVVAFGGGAAAESAGVLDLSGSLPEAVEKLSGRLAPAG